MRIIEHNARPGVHNAKAEECTIIDTIHGTGLETAHALPLTQYKNLRATRVSRETSVNVLLLLKVSKKPLRNNSTEARRFWGQVSI